MTLSICVRCGKSKVGAFVQCAACGFDPAANDVDRETQARALWLSDHYQSPAQLEAAAKKLKAGEPLPDDREQLAELIKLLETQGLPVVSTPRGCAVVVWLLFALLFGLLAVVIFLFYASSRS